MPSKLRFHRLFGELPFFEFAHRFAKFLHKRAGRVPVKVTAIGGAARVLGLFGQLFKLGATLEVCDDFFRCVLGFDQDMAGLEFFFCALCFRELLVFGLNVAVLDRMGFQMVPNQRTDHDVFAGGLKLQLDIAVFR